MRHLRAAKFFVLLVAFFCALTSLAPLAMADEVTVTGQLQVLGDEVVLETDSGEYILEGDNLEQFAGQTVSVTGALTESGEDKVIEVKDIKPAQ
ncbi:hypothetical protein SAMN02745206_01272 [Desulfacinum infernum DSM 9756]|uniref:DUF5666 domain-containing protein n=1 Tax=Desulfacinum infernum DSM 9756 TaxID=1121391 RepID=A0A1M4YJI6_9BACT|nr:DUF5818 domain-containing protein [Desulfacinum infernum]SHF05652.1 hypothetical protein SAMN02745206_01272 [Desulfacinum infernum DSM 9756]